MKNMRGTQQIYTAMGMCSVSVHKSDDATNHSNRSTNRNGDQFVLARIGHLLLSVAVCQEQFNGRGQFYYYTLYL